MTRYPPQGPPSDYSSGQGSSQDYYNQQQQLYGAPGQYGAPSQQPQYGAPGSTYDQYGSGQQNYGQPAYGGEDRGHAQSYHGKNEQPYQQYPQDQPPQQYGYGGEQYSHSQPLPPHQQQYGGGNQYGAPGYGGDQYPHNQHPSHQQQSGFGGYSGYPPAGGPEVETFKSHFDQPHQQQNYGQPPAYGGAPNNQSPYGAPGPAGPGTEQDRGLMGALAGGAAGGFAGHKVNHGFLGTIGGAVAGSMLEDSLKGKKKKDKKEKKHKKPSSRRGSSSSSSSSSSSDSGKHPSRGAVMAGNFSASSRHARLENDERVLVAECADCDGHHRESRIDLNDCLTNTNGRLLWARGGNFRPSARHVRLIHDGQYLEAELGDGRGGWEYGKVRLDERISNDNGRLVML